MNKTWGEIGAEALSLGFGDNTDYQELKGSFTQAYNEAQVYICKYVKNLISSLAILQEEGGSGYLPYDMSELVGDSFDSFVKVPLLRRGDKISYLSDYYTEGSIIYIPASVSGKITVYYAYLPKPISGDTPAEYPCELPYDAAQLMPYRMAYRVWLDDDERKAVMYNNEFVSMAENLIRATPRQLATIKTIN